MSHRSHMYSLSANFPSHHTAFVIHLLLPPPPPPPLTPQAKVIYIGSCFQQVSCLQQEKKIWPKQCSTEDTIVDIVRSSSHPSRRSKLVIMVFGRYFQNNKIFIYSSITRGSTSNMWRMTRRPIFIVLCLTSSSNCVECAASVCTK